MTQRQTGDGTRSRRRHHPAAQAVIVLLSITLTGCGRPLSSVGSAPEGLDLTTQISIRFDDRASSEGKPAVVVTGLPRERIASIGNAEWDTEHWHALLAVGVKSDDADSGARLAPMLGRYKVAGEAIRFEPRFELEPGLTYLAVFQPGVLRGEVDSTGLASAITHTFKIPKPPKTATRIMHVFPSIDTLPENLLKFYIHFSAPMRQGDSYRYIRLVDSTGGSVPYPFLELAEELWDHQGTRFTLFLHPGRIKRGLIPRQELGPALLEGDSYSLRIAADWPDAQGDPLAAPFVKQFRVGPPDTTQPDPKTWKVTAPLVGSSEPLVVEFAEPMDHSLLLRQLWINDASGAEVPGAADVQQNETKWSFVPERPWKAGPHKIVVDTTLEDLVGNSIGRLFDVDVFERIDTQIETETITLPFETVTPAGPR